MYATTVEKNFGRRLRGINYKKRENIYVILWDKYGRIGVMETCTGDFLIGGVLEADETHRSYLKKICLEEAGLVVEVGKAVCRGNHYYKSYGEKNEYIHEINYFYEGTAKEIGFEYAEYDYVLQWLSVGECKKKLYLQNHKWATTLSYLNKKGQLLDVKLTDSDFEPVPPLLLKQPTRRGARGVLFDDKNHIIVMYMGIKGSYKLPGGGLEQSELPEEAFIREVREETGYRCMDIKYIGEIQEHKNKTGYYQHSYCYIGKVGDKIYPTNLTANELQLGMKAMSVPVDEAIHHIRQDIKRCTEYGMKFMLKRDLLIMQHVKKYYMRRMISE